MQIKPTNKTVGDLINFYGRITDSFYPRYFVPQARAARKTPVTITGESYTTCPNITEAGAPAALVIYYINNMTGLEPQTEKRYYSACSVHSVAASL
jgi:hypothetical protein